jgi:hypothetical protein
VRPLDGARLYTGVKSKSAPRRAAARLSLPLGLLVGVLSAAVFVSGCARAVSPAELDQDGTRTYPRATRSQALHATIGALRTLGYEVTVVDEGQGRVKTAPRVLAVRAVGSAYVASVSEISLAWSIAVTPEGSGARIHAEPRGYVGGESTGLNANFAHNAFQTLFGEIDDQLGSSSNGATPSSSGVANTQTGATGGSPSTSLAPPSQEPAHSYYATSDASDDPRWMLAAELGYSSNDLEVGLGAHAGKVVFPHVYIGGAFVYHLGHDIAGAQTAGYSTHASFSAFYAGPEGGYQLNLSPVVVRIYAGLGLVWLNTSVTTTGPGVAGNGSSSASTNKFVIWPGAQAIYSVPSTSWFVSGDLRFVSVPDGPAVGAFVAGGLRL